MDVWEENEPIHRADLGRLGCNFISCYSTVCVPVTIIWFNNLVTVTCALKIYPPLEARLVAVTDSLPTIV